MKPYFKRALQLLEHGDMNKAQIANVIASEFSIEQSGVENIRKNISRWSKLSGHDALADYCNEVGIDATGVSHYWHKGKHMSVHAKVSAEKTYMDLRDEVIEDMKAHAPKYTPFIYDEDHGHGHLLVIDPADVHIGKLSSSFETGENYNNQIAVKRVKDGVHGILQKAKGFNIDKIALIAGNDILHIDNPKRTTTSGTPQDTDGMWYDNFLIAKRLYIEIIEKLISVAPVHFVFNPSNHDFTNGFFLADVISTWFHKCDAVTFDCSMSHRKYFRYHNNLIGSTHGDGAKTTDLPLLMAQEAPKDWSLSKHRYVYTHHVHHKTSKDFIGVTVESLRSPSGTDGWHHRNGYEHAPKAIEGFIHHKQHGQIARLTHIF